MPRRAPHAALDHASRYRKAKKIEHLVSFESLPQPVTLLEIGTGSGWIAQHLASRGARVSAVDVTDSRQVGGYDFRLVTDAELPFEDGAFQVVLSNHVLEHVGGPPEQRRHLAEIARVLAPGGVAYLAVPNRWMVVEPHYRLAFLSWLPEPLRSPYVRLRGKGQWYDCDPPSLRRLQALLAATDLSPEDVTLRAARLFLESERPGSVASLLPDSFLRALRPLIPTHVYLLRKRRA